MTRMSEELKAAGARANKRIQKLPPQVRLYQAQASLNQAMCRLENKEKNDMIPSDVYYLQVLASGCVSAMEDMMVPPDSSPSQLPSSSRGSGTVPRRILPRLSRQVTESAAHSSPVVTAPPPQIQSRASSTLNNGKRKAPPPMLSVPASSGVGNAPEKRYRTVISEKFEKFGV